MTLREPKTRLARRGCPPLEQLLEFVGQFGRRRQHARARFQFDEIECRPGHLRPGDEPVALLEPVLGRTRARDVVVEVGVGARDGVDAAEGDALELADAGHPHLVVVGDLDRDLLGRSDHVGLVELVGHASEPPESVLPSLPPTE